MTHRLSDTAIYGGKDGQTGIASVLFKRMKVCILIKQSMMQQSEMTGKLTQARITLVFYSKRRIKK